MLQTGRSRVRFPIVSLEFFTDINLPVALWPWGRLSLYQKWVPGIFPGGKGGRCVRLTILPPSCAVVMKSGTLNFLEPSGSFWPVTGLLYLLYRHMYTYIPTHTYYTHAHTPTHTYIPANIHVHIYIYI